MLNVASLIERMLPSASSRELSRPRGSLENPSTDLNDPEMWEAMGAREAASGILVSPLKALEFGPVFQCLEIKSGDIGASTLHCHANNVEPGKDDIDYNQSAEKVCSLMWNDVTPANEGWQNLVFHQQLFGSGYAYISRQGGSRNGPIQWMANLVPGMVMPVTIDGHGLQYRLQMSDGTFEFLNPWEVFHLRGIALENNKPLDTLSLMRNELGLALGAKLWLSKFFQRGGHHGGILMVPPGVKNKAMENLEKGVTKRADPSGWFKTMILRDGAKWQSATVDPRTAQMHELTDDEARAVCHFFNMPPWKLGLRDSASYNSGEMSQTAYITGTLLHVSTRLRGEAQLKLLSERTRNARSHRFEHDFSQLLQTDTMTLNQVLNIQRSAEIIDANEWRRKINMPARTEEQANRLYNPSTRTDNAPATPDSDATKKPAKGKAGAKTGSSDDVDDDETADNTDEEATDNTPVRPVDGLSHGTKQLLLESAGRVVRRMTNVCRNKSRKPAEFLAWVDSRLAEHAEIVKQELGWSIYVAVQCHPRAEARSNVLTLASTGWFTGQLVSGVQPFLESPHKESELERNVTEWCRAWAETAPSAWLDDIGSQFLEE